MPFPPQSLIAEQWSWLVNEASLEIVSKGGDFILILSSIADTVQLKFLGQKHWSFLEEVCGHSHVKAGYQE